MFIFTRPETPNEKGVKVTNEKEKRPRGRPKIVVAPEIAAKVQKIWANTEIERTERLKMVRDVVGRDVSEPWIYRYFGVPTAS